MTGRYHAAEKLVQRVGSNIRDLRLALGLSAKKAAEQSAGMHWRHWQKLEAGELNVTLRSIAKVVKALGVDPCEIFGSSPPAAERQCCAEAHRAGSSANEVEQELARAVGANVCRLRLALKMPVEKAADRANLNWRHWQKIETGNLNVTMQTIARAAQALRVDPAALISGAPVATEGAARKRS